MTMTRTSIGSWLLCAFVAGVPFVASAAPVSQFVESKRSTVARFGT